MDKQQQFFDALTRNHVMIERIKSGQVNEWAAFLKEIDRELRHKLSGKDLTDYKRNELEKQLREINALLVGIFNNHWEQLSGNLTDIADIEAIQTAAAFESVGLQSKLPTATAMATAIKTNPLQVNGADGGALLDVFAKDWTNTERKRIVGAIRKGYVLGQTNAEILQTVRGTKKAGYKDGILAQTDRHTKTMIRTAIAHVANAVRTETHKELGVEYEQLDATLDSRTTPICRALDQEIYNVGEAPQPPLHYNCRTVLIPYVPELAHLSDMRSSEFGYAKNEQYYTWLKRQTPKYQDDVLGKGRGKLFRSKGMTPEKFRRMQLDKNFNPITIKQLRKKVAPIEWKVAHGEITDIRHLNKADKANAIAQYHDDALANKARKKDLLIGKVPGHIKADNHDFSGMPLMLDQSGIRHVNKNHGDIGSELMRGQVAIDITDVQQLERILQHGGGAVFDKVHNTDKNQVALSTSPKTTANEYEIVLVKKANAVYLKTMWKK